MKETLIGDKAIIGQVLDKIELAVRRAIQKNHLYPADALETLAGEILKIKQDLYHD